MNLLQFLLAASVIRLASSCGAPATAHIDTTCGFEKTTWGAPASRMCEDGNVETGDFNGDGKADVLCTYPSSATKDYDVYLSRAASTYEGIDYTIDHLFCSLPADTIFIGDFNGDHHDDVLCREADGSLSVVFNEMGHYFGESFVSTPVSYDTSLLCPVSDYNMYIGDFDGDRISDILCHHITDGHSYLTYGRHNVGRQRRHIFFPYGTVTPHTHGPAGSATLLPLHFCFDTNDVLLIGDVDRNGRDDMVCYDNTAEDITIGYMDFNGHLVPSDTLNYAATGLCLDGSPAYLIQGDNDHRADLFCESAATTPEVYLYLLRDSGDVACKGVVPITPCADQRIFADVNGDGRDDMICFKSANPSAMKIYYNECD